MSTIATVTKPTKIVISLKDFLAHTKINYTEDLWDHCYHEFQRYSPRDIVNNLPKKYAHITEEKLENNTILLEAFSRALNRADEQAMLDQMYADQNKGVEEFCDNLADMINTTLDKDQGQAVNSIIVDWDKEEVTLNVNLAPAIKATIEIINGQGYFQFDTMKEFILQYDGKYNPKRALEHHLHYLLNYQLINDIYGLRTRDIFTWGTSYWSIDDDNFSECIDEEMDEIMEKVSTAREMAAEVEQDFKCPQLA